jgi:hypothetical protein
MTIGILAVTVGGATVATGLGIGAATLGAGVALSEGAKNRKTTNAATKSANDTTLQMYNQTREDQAPWREAGAKAVQDYSNALAAGPGTFNPQTEPGFQYGWNNLAKQYLGAASAKGKRFSGETAVGLGEKAQDYASQGYSNFLSRYYQKLSALSNLAGLGQNSANTTSQAGMNTASTIGQNTLNAAQSNVTNSQDATGVALGAINNGVNNYLTQSYLQKLGVLNQPSSYIGTKTQSPVWT